MMERKAIMMRDTRDESKVDASSSMKLMNVQSVMCVPLVSKSIVRGVIYVDSVSAPHGFRTEDLSLLTALSSPAAIAIENAALYSEYLEEKRS
jgi:GAF domain-containing protein